MPPKITLTLFFYLLLELKKKKITKIQFLVYFISPSYQILSITPVFDTPFFDNYLKLVTTTTSLLIDLTKIITLFFR